MCCQHCCNRVLKGKPNRGWERGGDNKPVLFILPSLFSYERIRFLDPVASFSSLLSGHSIDQLRMLLGQNKVSRKRLDTNEKVNKPSLQQQGPYDFTM